MNRFKLFTILTVSTVILSACGHTGQQATDATISKTEQENLTVVSPNYVDYSPTAIADATADGGKVVLFFHAAWCPTCRSAEKDILSRIDELDPTITIIKTDYDTENELKKKYNVTYQHTFVQVDKNGELVTLWNGGSLNEINKRTK